MYPKVTRRTLLKQAGGVGLGVTGLGFIPGLVAACGQTQGAPSTDLIVAHPGLFTSLDQDYAVEYSTQEAALNIGARLIRPRYIDDPQTGFRRQDTRGTTDSYELELAQSFDVSADGKTYTFKLKTGVISPAGNELTADDVLYTVERKINVGAAGAFLQDFGMHIKQLSQVERVDKYTVSFHIPAPFPTFLATYANAHAGSIEDSKLMKSKATTTDPWSLDFAKNNSHGFGPYSVASHEAGKEAVFVANEHFVRPVPIKRMTWRVVPDSSTRLALVKRGEVHIGILMQPREIESVKSSPGIVIPKATTNFVLFAVLNLGRKPFDDTRVRQAFSYVIPYDDIVTKVLLGQGRRASIMWDLSVGATNAFSKTYNLDIQKARQLLAAAGLPNGFDTDFGYELGVPISQQVATFIRESAAGAGIRVNLKGLTPTAINEMQSPQGIEGAIPYLTLQHANIPSPPYQLLLFTAVADWASYKPHRANSDKFYAAVNQGEAVGDDGSDAAKTFWAEAQTIATEDAPYAWIAWLDPPYIMRDNVKKWPFRTDNVIDYSELTLG